MLHVMSRDRQREMETGTIFLINQQFGSVIQLLLSNLTLYCLFSGILTMVSVSSQWLG